LRLCLLNKHCTAWHACKLLVNAMLTELFYWSVWLYHNTQIVPGCVKHSQADLYDNTLRDYSAEVMHWVNLRPAQQSSTMHKEAFRMRRTSVRRSVSTTVELLSPSFSKHYGPRTARSLSQGECHGLVVTQHATHALKGSSQREARNNSEQEAHETQRTITRARVHDTIISMRYCC
jgi:hypothetical protein